jgi:hypothetical protein
MCERDDERDSTGETHHHQGHVHGHGALVSEVPNLRGDGTGELHARQITAPPNTPRFNTVS